MFPVRACTLADTVRIFEEYFHFLFEIIFYSDIRNITGLTKNKHFSVLSIKNRTDGVEVVYYCTRKKKS